MCATRTPSGIVLVRDCCDSRIARGHDQRGDRSSPVTGRRGRRPVDSALGQLRTHGDRSRRATAGPHNDTTGHRSRVETSPHSDRRRPSHLALGAGCARVRADQVGRQRRGRKWCPAKKTAAMLSVVPNARPPPRPAEPSTDSSRSNLPQRSQPPKRGVNPNVPTTCRCTVRVILLRGGAAQDD
jgi:hypothetical protein